MTPLASLDSQVRTRLQSWPQRPPGLLAKRDDARWMRARPAEGGERNQPFLKLPGSNRMKTLPDGLWLEFGGSRAEAYVDLVAIEACGSVANLFDKRSRFAPSTQSMMVVCPVVWLRGAVGGGNPMKRWQRTGLLRDAPTEALILPVRDMRVVYALKQRQYLGFVASQVPHAHEYFVPMDALVAEKSDEDPAMRALFARVSASANFLEEL